MILVALLFLPGSVLASGIIDPCRRMCEEFSADGRGNGFDLCEGGTSECITSLWNETCSNLYWASSETGERGVIFGTDITSDEHVGELSCLEAANIVDSHYNPLIQVAFAIFSNLRPLRGSGGAAANYIISQYRRQIIRGGPLLYTTVHFLNQMIHGEENFTTMLDVVSHLLGGFETPETSHEIRCPQCGLWMFEDEQVVIEADGRSNFVQLLTDQLRTPLSGQYLCPHCQQHSNDLSGMVRMRNPSTMFSIRLNRNGTNVTTPTEIDLSSVLSLPNSLYTLVAQTHTGVTPRAGIRTRGTWYQVNATHSLLQENATSEDYDWFIYQRLD